MKKRILLFIILSGLFLTNSYSQKEKPEFKAVDIYGEIHTLTDYLDEGKYVFLDFFTLPCGNCQLKAPIVDSVYRDFGCNSSNIVFLGLECSSSGETTDEQIYDFCQQYSMTFDAISGLSGGRAVADLYEVAYTPYFLLISPDNEIVMENYYFNSAQELKDSLMNFGLVPNICEGADFLRYELVTEIDTIRGELNFEDRIINIQVPIGTDLTNCGALFISETNSDVYIDNTEQVSGETINDFLEDLNYTIFAENSDIENNWTIIIEEVSEIKESKVDIKIYPNPADNFIFIDDNKISDRIEIFDSKGNLITSQKIMDNKLDISNLERGIYFFKIKKDGKIFVEKIIKK